MRLRALVAGLLALACLSVCAPVKAATQLVVIKACGGFPVGTVVTDPATVASLQAGPCSGSVVAPTVTGTTPTGPVTYTVLAIQPSGCTLTTTAVTLPAGTSTQIAPANALRRTLAYMDVGQNPMTVSSASPAVVDQGINYEGSSGSGHQGGSDSYSGAAVPTNALYAVSALGTTVNVAECQ